jgi:alkylation response protein AidB-like acyl-CoA dehydrogenase
MLERTIFRDEHRKFRQQVRDFLEKEVLPHHIAWETRGYVDRTLWNLAGSAGFLCPTISQIHGGRGNDRLYSVVLTEETAKAGASGLGWGLHSDIVAPYIEIYGAEYLKDTYLPAMAKGTLVGAIAMTEPSAGSDLKGIVTSARRVGNDYIVNGSKIFVTNGWHCDLVILAVKTTTENGNKSISLLLAESATAGFSRGQLLKKSGMCALDTVEIFFDEMRVPVGNILGREGEGFSCLMQQLPWERLQAAIYSIASAEAALEATISFTKEHYSGEFERPLNCQNTRFTLAELKTEIQIGRVFVDRCIELLLRQKLDAATASMAKVWATNLQFKTMETCAELHGEACHLSEFPIDRVWADSGIYRLAGGSNEIMKELISRSL